MKRILFTAGLASLMVLAGHAQQTTVSTTPGVSSQTTVQPNTSTTTSQQTQGGTTTSGALAVPGGQVQTQNQLPQTGQATGFNTNTTQTTQLRIQAFTPADQPVATQIQQTLTAQPVLAQTLPMVNIQVNGGVVILDGNVQCGAEGVLMQNLIQQQLPNTIRIDNRLRLSGGAPLPRIR